MRLYKIAAGDKRTVLEKIKSIFFTLPKHVRLNLLLKYTGTGAAAGSALGYLLGPKKHRLISTLIGGGTGAGLGAYTYALRQNILYNIAGLRGNDYNYGYLDPANTGAKKKYIVYIAGADDKPLAKHDLLKPNDPNTVLVRFPFGDPLSAISYINKIRPTDLVTLIGHSAGGGAAINIALNVSRKIDHMHTLDPVDLNPYSFIKRILFGGAKAKEHTKHWINHLPRNSAAKVDDKNFWYLYKNPMLLGELKLAYNIVDSLNHSMRLNGLRLYDELLLNFEKAVNKYNRA